MIFCFVYMLVCIGVAHGSRIVFEDDYLSEGSKCKTKYGAHGICRPIGDCPYELHIIKYFPAEFRAPICAFNGSQPIVCCAEPSLRPSQQACDSQRQYRHRAGSQSHAHGGREAHHKSHPHVVALGYLNSEGTLDWLCGGSLINQFYVLTAAHCVANQFRGRPDVVWAGVHNLSNTAGQVIQIESFVLHPLYTPTSHYHDIALLKVNNVTMGKDIKPACLSNTLDDPKEAAILGWGATDKDGILPTSIIQSADLKSVPFERCNESYAGRSFVSRKLERGIIGTQICAEGANGKADSCRGDSGGPLQITSTASRGRGGHRRLTSTEYIVFGVVSFGKPQFCSSIGVYTRVASYLDWIESIVWPNGIVGNKDE